MSQLTFRRGVRALCGQNRPVFSKVPLVDLRPNQEESQDLPRHCNVKKDKLSVERGVGSLGLGRARKRPRIVVRTKV